MQPTDDNAPAAKKPGGFDASWLALIAAALVLGYIGSSVWESNHPKPAAPMTQTSTSDPMKWVSIAEATTVAKQTGKPILYDFSAEWCTPCQNLKRSVFDEPTRARALSETAVPVMVIDRYREEGRNPPEIDELQQRYGVTAFPTLVLVDAASGRQIKSEGFMGADETVQWVKSGANSVRLGVAPDGSPLR